MRLGDAAIAPPFQEVPFLLPAIGDLREGDASGVLRVRVQYGKTKDKLSHCFEAKYQLPSMVFNDETRGMHMMVNYVLESLETR